MPESIHHNNSNIDDAPQIASAKKQLRASNPTSVIRFPEDFKNFDANNVKQMRRIVQPSQAYCNLTFIQGEHTKEELCCSYVDLPAANMKRLENVDTSIPLSLEQNITKTSKMIDQAKQLAWALTAVAANVFWLNIQALNLFCNEIGRKFVYSSGL
ncbi:unnamed protein product [Rotaria socialis]|uniref:Uncharacterized protein n=1 Tax=Rotaria socialis TaxID=392032 RepID=A0A820PN11_9BILA|nr:unnamed protein product [Rotaria socialis]CAF3546301.1 unnamed protein product [Rotaria socialis]CAF3700637.1 unnamed protein product [Rotaria socialis]CAF4409758.1 unnamed protein product [Rotaria socialis]CAF4494821.1 unnamed protein product [Rotaria socialis]